MNGVRIILYILSLYAILLADKNEALIAYENGMDAYRKGQYELAIQELK